MLTPSAPFSATGNSEERQPAAARRERRPDPRDIPPVPLTPVPGAPHAGSAPADGAAGEDVDPATDAAVAAAAAAAATAAAQGEAEAAALRRLAWRPSDPRSDFQVSVADESSKMSTRLIIQG